MHIVLGALGSIVTILWLFYRLAEMGIDLGGLNPFLWQRRRRWKKLHDGNPVYKLDSPLEATALLMTAVAKADGDMSAEEKSEILKIFSEEFHLSDNDASGLLISSSHLLGKGEEVRDHLKKVLAPSLSRFTQEQADSAIELIARVSRIAGPASDLQNRLVTSAGNILGSKNSQSGKWS
ncbi:MAG TPA: TerB family tellurite resistance protein [Gammaproteobacteria bacterium]|nr:TerB family tellurite resistance protein [Gammaproteobacteria bacterium]